MEHKAATSTELMSAFQAFQQDSSSLEKSYQRLEEKVDVLNQQLTESNRKRLQELAEKQVLADRLSCIMAALPVGIVTLDNDGALIEWNPLAELLLGEKLNEKSWVDIVENILSRGCIAGSDVVLENGKLLQIGIHSLNQEGRVVMLHDSTEANSLREQASNNEKLSAIGEMTAGLVHQIRTPLTSAFLYLEKIASEMSSGKVSDDTGITALWRLKESLNIINSTVNDLLLFSKDRQTHTESVLISEFLDTIQDNARDELDKYGSVLDVELAVEDCELSINKYAMQGAVQNLITNALQAGARRIVLSLKDIDGEYFELLVKDDGCGMSVVEKEKIFSPFFTTKSQGYGFGLSIVKSVIELNGGHIDLLESSNEGSCFLIKLPYVDCMKTPLKSNISIN